MIFDAQIVAHATAFVNALQAHKPAHIPAMRFEHWQQFFTTVRALMEGVA
ncbi:succinate dehydrogenase flavoprotein subunit [Candidatus Pantoea multigeneris]|uniref:Succinate dehydrogenase flavoprotein subunit n=1 Tax=Candidatus Pantoea multigeneris TaxID=2608357 RepID=A0ABX0RH42_9GAMM|nr:succinate dehydrogenase flavoprotein subunit [Pantoea multigeneris]NIF24043.1 succinate dehydrogenase flavoprotein subunit [Pantoea multigeneris]